MSEDVTESRHGKNADGTWKPQVTFRGSSPDDQRLARLLKAEKCRTGRDYSDVIREALTQRYAGQR